MHSTHSEIEAFPVNFNVVNPPSNVYPCQLLHPLRPVRGIRYVILIAAVVQVLKF